MQGRLSIPDLARSRWLVPAALGLVLLLAVPPALKQVNVTWDEALGDFFFGERYLSFFCSFDPAYLDFKQNPYPPERVPDLSVSPFRGRPWEYYPVANTLAAATSAVVSRGLGWLDPFDGYHAVNLPLAVLLGFGLFRMLRDRWGAICGTAALGLLFGAPRVVAHLLANVKDFPLMVFFTLTLAVFLRAYEKGSARGLAAAGALWGLALGTKANALFLPAIVLAVVLAAKRPAAWRGRRGRLWLALGGAGLLGPAVMVASWPYLWADPVGRFAEHLRYIGFRRDAMSPDAFAPVLQALVLTTPIPFLLLAALGLGVLVPRLRRREPLAWLLAAWIAVVLGRYLPPQAVNFDGVRHFLELFPALAAAAGLGASWLASKLAQAESGTHRGEPEPRAEPAAGPAAAGSNAAGWKVAAWKAAVTTVLLVPGAWSVAASHPFEIAYWNGLAGGYSGARERGLPQACDYWGTSYRLGLDWLNENAPRGSLLAVPVVEHAVRLVAPQRLRPDIVLLPVTTPYSSRIAPERLEGTRTFARERPVYVMFVERRDWMNALMRDCLEHLEPEAEWQLDGAPVLQIYRYRPPPAAGSAQGLAQPNA